MKHSLSHMVREAVTEFRESLVGRSGDHDLTAPSKAYVKLQTMVGLHGHPTPDGLTMKVNQPVGDIVALTLDKNGGLYDLVEVDAQGGKRRLDATSFLDPDKAAELDALCNELTVQMEGH